MSVKFTLKCFDVGSEMKEIFLSHYVLYLQYSELGTLCTYSEQIHS